ncbi:MAG TPA: Gfo/Idh/MocA family oxidoreductase [Tepidisphaeraceae bacterium]|jgi:predicted dehydrogenase
MADKKEETYGLTTKHEVGAIAAPALPYRPATLKNYQPVIGLIACGGITESHLKAYKGAGYNVVALCDLKEEKAAKRRDQFFPDAKIYTDYRELLKRDDIDVVDVATHPPDRPPIIEDALRAHKHVLSQKPFCIDLQVGQRMADLADKMGVKLAVNQNGRWAPHWSYIRHAINAGLLGDVAAVQLSVNWDHSFIKGTVFENIHHIVLYDFGIHWFDITATFFGNRKVKSVYATVNRAPGQTLKPPLLAQCVIEFEDGQATLHFDAFTRYGQQDRTYVAGSKGSAVSVGPSLTDQSVTVYTDKGYFSPKLEGSWFPNGFHGTMAELLSSIEEKRTPSNNAHNNLKGLELCFAAVASAEDGKPKKPGEVRTLVA